MFKYLTSDVDWCEDNFVYCDKIAEMWNSLTSCAFVFFGLFGIYKMPIKKVPIYFFFANNIFIGLTSVFFHSTLSIEGQVLDEFSILFYTVNGIIYLEKYHRTHIYSTILAVTGIPIAVYVYPIMNRLLLFTCAVPYVLYIARKNRNYLATIDYEILNLIKYCKKSFAISFVCWIIDYLCFLPFSSHLFWHILVAYTAYTLTVILQIVSYNRYKLYKNLLHVKYTKYGMIPYLEFDNYQDRYCYF